jgi:predicted DNA-binding transcriptional regulator AlpA
MDSPQKLLRTPDAAKYLDLSASALEKYRVLGRGPAFVKLGRRVAYTIADLDAWIAASRRRSTAEGAGR